MNNVSRTVTAHALMALATCASALARVPEHPTANAYMLLFGGSDSDRARALQAAPKARANTDDNTRERTLLDAAVAFSERGPLAGRAVLTPTAIGDDRELAFWAAEFDYRAGNFKASRDAYAALLAQPQQAFRGRIYDHYSSVLLYLDEPDEALRIGTLYRDAFPGEADAVAVYASTLEAVGDYSKAIAAAEDALACSALIARLRRCALTGQSGALPTTTDAWLPRRDTAANGCG
jgi:tetratricopeptide (TPR) repeat protein